MRFDHALDVSHGGFEWKHELVGFVLPRDYVEDAAHGGRRERHRDALPAVNRQMQPLSYLKKIMLREDLFV